jgi:hypothetical protein
MNYEFHPEAELEVIESAAWYESFVLRRFPFSVIYAVTGPLLYVLAVAHGSRGPGYWKSRLAKD